MEVRTLTDLLWSLESAPSAVHLVAGILCIELDFEPYDESEGFNDSWVEARLNSATLPERHKLWLFLQAILKEQALRS